MKTNFYLCIAVFCNAIFGQTINLQSFATGFSEPVEITHPNNDERLF